MAKKRALIVVRLSRTTEATTSPERQREECLELCDKRGYEVVGEASDLDVSAGATTPFERKELGPWLCGRHDEFDVLVFYRADRLVRRLVDLADMIRWSEEHRVTLVSVDEPYFDLSTPMGKTVSGFVASIGEMELEAIRARNAGAFRHNIRAGKWRGGVPPWGYLPTKVDGEWRLAQDPEQVAVIHEVVDRVLGDNGRDGESLRSIAHDLTTRKILTPKDRFAQSRKREVAGYEWHSGPLKRGLTSRTLLGQIVTREAVLDSNGQVQRNAKGQRVLGPEIVVRGKDGSPVVRAAPILDRATFDRVGAALAGRENRKEPSKRTHALLRQVIHCGECGRAGYRLKGGEGRKPRYRCGSAQYKDQCTNRTISLEWADEQVEQKILSTVGPMERMRRTWVPGSDVTAELEEVNAVLVDLTEQLGTGNFRKGTPQRASLDAHIAALSERQEELMAQRPVAAGWRYVGTGETVAAWWASADGATRNAWLRELGVRATWRSSTADGRTEIDDFTIDLGDGPDLAGPVLPGPMAGAAEAAGAFRSHEPAVADVMAGMARGYWREGDPLQEVIDAE